MHTFYLIQRITVALQRGNEASMVGSGTVADSDF